ncbi:hypothetical protein BCR33DRAFT_733377 [Rhizoclosmatium globosum]|uniref:Uncharacterized protein n=1 Tax=Rhizoclosmatium globosum TaxID=329046 RepID=A0A1Y2CZN0_9FUNG|nr:hypothetical protein BCR33DRAFT_733377 [Rhizoclosmatium globosum]|eukprot:ORY51805.1 hypothetical protein BCR33DRAFT_733377 [Rhizoclosmatium globosum]
MDDQENLHALSVLVSAATAATAAPAPTDINHSTSTTATSSTPGKQRKTKQSSSTIPRPAPTPRLATAPQVHTNNFAFSIRTSPQGRLVKKKDAFEIANKSLQELKRELFTLALEYIGKWLVNNRVDGKPKWALSQQQKPDIVFEDFTHFVRFDCGKKSKSITLEQLTGPILVSCSTATIKIILVENSYAILSAPDYEVVQKTLLKLPADKRDRGNAPNSAAIRELANKLRDKWGTSFKADSVHWSMYATYCYEKEDELDERIAAGPPTDFRQYFKTQPINAQLVLDEQRNNNKIALGVNKRKRDALSNLWVTADNNVNDLRVVSQLLERAVQSAAILKDRLKAEVESCNVTEDILNDRAAEIDVKENAISHESQLRVVDMEDIDHAL